MKRNVSLSEISDGRLYTGNDMVKADCNGCKGCADCCSGMGNSIILDPYDVYRLTLGLKKSMTELLQQGSIELNVVDGCILPNLKMTGTKEACSFLNPQGRCSIHPVRPGICRLFPLGRYYENGDFKYFLQTGECSAEKKSKVKVAKWIDTPRQSQNHAFICQWHYLLKDTEALLENSGEEKAKQVNMVLLQCFFINAYEDADFYTQFKTRYEQFKKLVFGEK